jgi:hypothetical protein
MNAAASVLATSSAPVTAASGTPGITRSLTKVPFGALGVVHAVDETEAFQRFPERVGRLQRRDRDLGVDHRFGGQPGHRSGPDVVDTQRHRAEGVA